MNKKHSLVPVLALIALVAGVTHAAEPSSTYIRDWLLTGPITLQGPDPAAPDFKHLQARSGR